MSSDPSPELSILVEKLRALQTLMHYERDLGKLKFYKCELEIIEAKLHEAEITLHQKKQNAKVLPFVPKNPVRSA